jgi:hypothetical protein
MWTVLTVVRIYVVIYLWVLGGSREAGSGEVGYEHVEILD